MICDSNFEQSVLSHLCTPARVFSTLTLLCPWAEAWKEKWFQILPPTTNAAETNRPNDYQGVEVQRREVRGGMIEYQPNDFEIQLHPAITDNILHPLTNCNVDCVPTCHALFFTFRLRSNGHLPLTDIKCWSLHNYIHVIFSYILATIIHFTEY